MENFVIVAAVAAAFAILGLFVYVALTESKHRHKWAEVRRSIQPPARRTAEGGFSEEFLHEIAFGFTTVELHCECGDITYRKLPGGVPA